MIQSLNDKIFLELMESWRDAIGDRPVLSSEIIIESKKDTSLGRAVNKIIEGKKKSGGMSW